MTFLAFTKPHLSNQNNLAVEGAAVSRHLTRLSVLSAALCALLLGAGCSNGATESSNTTAAMADEKTATAASQAPQAGNDASVVSALQDNLKASGINETITSAVATEMPGIYWVTAEGLPSFFTDKQGKHIIQGQIIQVGGENPIDISAALVARSAKEKLAKVDKKDMIIYSAKGATKAAIYVFTDADCPYCHKLHEEIAQITASGIEVRYLAWPRSEPSIPKSEAIWCSKDRNQAMDQAMAGSDIKANNCQNPVRAQIELGMSLGVNGTPAIFTEDGQQVGGYLPAAQLAQAVGVS